MTFEDVRQIAFSFPGVEEHLVFGGPTLRIRKRFLACIAKIDPNTLCIKVPDVLLRELLLENRPDIYYLTDHYAAFECLLVRLPLADPAELRDLFALAWRTYAPKRLVTTWRSLDS